MADVFSVTCENAGLPTVAFNVTPPDPQAENKAAFAAHDALRALNILLVEDQPVTQMLVVLLLKKWGHCVQTANDGLQGLECFQRNSFDVVLMDLQMPVMDGISATRAMREHELQGSLGRTPIIAMTAQTAHGDREMCIAAGMDNYLPKPVTATALQDILNEHCQPRPGA